MVKPQNEKPNHYQNQTTAPGAPGPSATSGNIPLGTHTDDEDEYDSLVRLSHQAQTRTRHEPFSDSSYIPEDDIEIGHSEVEDEEDDEEGGSDDDDEGEDYDMIEPATFLQSLLQLHGRRVNGDDDDDRFEEVDNANEGEEEEINEDDDDPRAEFLRAIGALSGRREGDQTTPSGANAGGTAGGFVDVMQRLMGGGMMFGEREGNGETDALINNLNQREDTYIMLESLNELSERLLMMNGITAERLIPANKLAKSLVNIMEDPQLEEELELHLVACRCLYNFLEVNQDFIHDALNNNAIRALCHKLVEIKYIDLTEQVLQTLEMISRDPISHNSIISNNGLTCLQYLDFLTIHAQRKCLTIISNCCTNISIANFPMVKEAFTGISDVVRTHEDQVVVENAWLTISRIIICFRNKPDYLNELFSDKGPLLLELTQVISISCNKGSNDNKGKKLNYASCLSLIKSLIILTSVSVEVSKILICDCEIGKVITKSLNKYGRKETDNEEPEKLTIESIMAAPKDLISQFLSLIGYLLPITYTPENALFLRDNFQDYEERQEINKSRQELCLEIIPNDYWQFVNDVWPFLIISFEATMDYDIRRKGFINMYRILYSAEEFTVIHDVATISGLLSSVVNQCQSTIHTDFASHSQWEDIDMEGSDEEESAHPVRSEPEDINKINANALLLASFKIIRTIFEKSHGTAFISNFEREGLIKDIISILSDLKGNVDDDFYETGPPVHSISASYSNKYIDTEVTKEYESRLTLARLYARIYSVGNEIEQLYLAMKSGDTVIPEHMKVLIEIQELLQDQKLIKSFTFEQWIDLWNKLKFALIDNVQISSFELISSGLIEALTTTFKSEEGSESPCNRAFTAVFFELDTVPAKAFVQKLQEALTRSESFDVVSAGTNTNQHNHALANQIRLKLTCEGEDKIPTHLKTMILSVHAIATFKSVFAFLKQRFRFMEEFSDDEEKKSDINIEFLINGEVIPNETTIYGAIYRSLQNKPDQIIEPSRIWTTVHNITYRKVSSEVKDSPVVISYDQDWVYDQTTMSILKLLKVIFYMNEANGSIPDKEFTNWKLAVKLNRQLEEPLVVASGTLPGWSIHVTKQFPFIFPLETRIFFLQSTSFGYSRLIHQWQVRTNQGNEEQTQGQQHHQLGRPTRHKVRIARQMMLQSAVKVLGLYGSTPGILEIEYFDEVGSGLGPTLEFYSTVSKEFGKRKLKMWRDHGDPSNSEGYVDNKYGLFPVPTDKSGIASENGNKMVYFFSILGKFIARALLDSRIIDFNFNPVFLKLVQLLNSLGNAQKLSTKSIKKFTTMANLRIVDPALADSVKHLVKYIKKFSEVRPEHRDGITVDGCTIKDLSIYFELPGNPEYELIPNGGETQVTASNLELYVSKILEATLYTGIIHQIKAFMEGFSKVFPINSLVIFSPQELVELFGNAEEDWSFDALTSSINANHGYSKESQSIKSLTNILVNFNHDEQRAFLQFLTGAPKLPIGGFKALRPPLTVVRKHAEDDLKDDDYLPSVMTCANYLKLPNYSSEDLMREKLLQAIREGAGAFLLS